MVLVDKNQNKEAIIDKVVHRISPNHLCKRNGWIITFAYHNNKTIVWQTALELELDGQVVGYGFGSTMEEVKEDVFRLLIKRVQMDRVTYQALLS